VPSDTITYTFNSCTELPTDIDTTNDCQSTTIEAIDCTIHDVGVIALIAPDTVCVDSTVNLCVTVQNFGNVTDTFDVVSTVDGFADTQVVNLAPGDTTTICFNWVPSDTITYTFTSCTELAGDADTTNDCQSTTIEAIDCAVHDVGVIALISPDTVCVDSTVNLCVTVENFGDATETFDVVSTVDGTVDTQQVANLAPGDTTTICFNWVPSDTITYTFNSCTELSTDSDTTNDCQSTTIESIDCAVHDVGVIALISPDTVCVDSTVNLCVTVENFGDATETFDVVSTVDGFAELTGDADTTNDCQSTTIEAIDCAIHDVGVIALIAPDTVCINSTVNLCVTVENFGDATETFDVVSTVDGFADTTTVSNLAPGDTTTFCFNWVPSDSITYTFISCTELAGDADTTNDCDNTPIVSIDCTIHDVGVIALISPDTVCVDSTVNLCVTVQNFGNVSDTFDVISTIDGFADTQIVDLAPGDTTTICFNWMPSDTITYTFNSCTELAGDADTTNDCQSTTIEAIDCAIHDVGVIALISPDTVCVDSTVNLCVTVENFGDATETFEVVSTVNGTADTQQVANLAPGDTTTICFNWVPSDTITYTFASCTELPTDIDTTNDCDNTPIVSIDCTVHDVGVIALIAPDTVCVDSTVNLCVTVENFGDATETFDVISTVDGFADTTTVSNLAPGDTTTICFNWVPSDTITYTFNSCTELSTDSDTTNDCQSTTIEAIDCAVHDVGVIALIAPDTVCINSTVNLCVTVENFGDATETFDVVSTVDGTVDTQQVANLAPGDTTTICFNWVPSDTITYTFNSCTELAGDADTTNDCQSTTIKAIDCTIHDVGVIALISPDTVCVDSTVNLCVTVQNFGNVTDTFDVISTIDGFADTQIVDLAPGDTTTICFNWVPTDTITYTFTSCTELAGDADTTNDCQSTTIEAIDCAIHDVGVIALISPDTVCVDSTVNLCVTVENFGDATETFDVVSTVDGTVDTQQVANLAPGDTTTICFNWVPSDTITYTFASCTELPTDIDTINDCQSTTIEAIDCVIVGIPEIPSELIPKRFSLSQNLPNPFSRNTKIRYALPQVEDKITVHLAVYDITGRMVEVLVNQSQEPGYYTIPWDAKSYSNGIYFYRLKAQMGQAGDFVETKKMIVLR
jgi:hypothetical protein